MASTSTNTTILKQYLNSSMVRMRGLTAEKLSRKLEKPLDKYNALCYNKDVPRGAERKNIAMKRFRRFYLTKIFVEWRDNPNEEMHLSLVSLSTFVDGLLGRLFNPDFHFEFKWVPPWRIQIGKN